MASWVVLLRGINVGGRNKLPMADLRALLEGLGAEGVQTYIQSGNAVLRSTERSAARLERAIAEGIEAGRGFRPGVMVLRKAVIDAALAGNPFTHAAEPKHVHVCFLAQRPKAGTFDDLLELAAADEEAQLEGQLLYLHAPSGMARSKLAAAVERRLGVEATARNLRTVEALAELAAGA
ncbi:MAG: DUF1697 domain-containing protein [Planctomycetota bacterium]